MASGKVDFSGVWQKPYVPDLTKDGKDFKGIAELPFTPWGEAEWKKYDAADGDYTGACLPFGMTRSITPPSRCRSCRATPTSRSCSSRIPGSRWRRSTAGRIGRGSPPGSAIQSVVGKATRWSSTRSTSTASTRLDTVGHPHSDQLHLVQRFTRPDLGHINHEMIIEDPKTFTRPWKTTRTFTLRPDWEMMDTPARKITRASGRAGSRFRNARRMDGGGPPT